MKKLISIIISLIVLSSCDEGKGYSFNYYVDTLCNYHNSKILGKYKVIDNKRYSDKPDTLYVITLRFRRVQGYGIKDVRVVKYEYDRAVIGTIVDRNNI